MYCTVLYCVFSGSGYTPSAKRARGDPRDPEDEVMRKLFVGNMNVTSTKESVEEYFQNFGELENVYCPTGKGYAFMTFKYASGIDAVQRARPHKVDDRLVDSKRSTPKEFAGIPDMEARSKKLYISGARSYGEEAVGGHSGLTDDITDNDLEQYFSQYGTVTSIDQKVWPDTGKKRGVILELIHA
jgi:RNA recognition motif-containing protein